MSNILNKVRIGAFSACIVGGLTLALATPFLRNDPLCFAAGGSLLLFGIAPSIYKGKPIVDGMLASAGIIGVISIGFAVTGWVPRDGFTVLSDINYRQLALINSANKPGRLFLKSPLVQAHSYDPLQYIACSYERGDQSVELEGAFKLQVENLDLVRRKFPLGLDSYSVSLELKFCEKIGEASARAAAVTNSLADVEQKFIDPETYGLKVIKSELTEIKIKNPSSSLLPFSDS